MRIVVAIPCHRDEPAVVQTVRQVLDQIESFPDARVVVCVNGSDPGNSPAARAVEPLVAESDSVQLLLLDRASKPAAWNRLREEPAEITVFCDADVRLEPGSVGALVAALSNHSTAVVAAGRQRPAAPRGFVGKVATVPFRLDWGGIAGTLYAARMSWLPEMPEDVLLDDAWLWAQTATLEAGAVVRVPEAVAVFRPAETLRDLWRQRVRAEAGKRQLLERGLTLAAPAAGAGRSALASYPRQEWPAVVALATIKAAAALWSRIRPARWDPAASTKG